MCIEVRTCVASMFYCGRLLSNVQLCLRSLTRCLHPSHTLNNMDIRTPVYTPQQHRDQHTSMLFQATASLQNGMPQHITSHHATASLHDARWDATSRRHTAPHLCSESGCLPDSRIPGGMTALHLHDDTALKDAAQRPCGTQGTMHRTAHHTLSDTESHRICPQLVIRRIW